ncbi:tyrosine-type recombinase/integrase [Helicobacter rodentium]|uniref:tyrosine-type recombinase/integrase n=1 Tax=Helicobacter rodentium TaxID=59617 RepID=UPI002354BE7C|nr:site-specific integrase [Helicobacter rodentium]
MKNIYINNGRIYIDYYENGKRFRKSTGLEASAKAVAFVKKNYIMFQGNKKNIKEAKRLFYVLIHNKNLKAENDEPEQRVLSFEVILKAFLNEKLFLKNNTISLYDSIISCILDFLSCHNIFLIHDFERKHSIDFLKYLQKNSFSAKTIKIYFSTFSMVFKYAIENGLIDKNPLFLPKMKQSLKTENEINPFTLEEALNLIKNAQDDLKTYLVLAFFTGARIGEILALTFEDIDFQKREIIINKSLSEKGIIDSPKTLSSNRVIDMLDIVYKHLKTLKYQSLKQRIINAYRHKLRVQFDNLQTQLGLKRRRLYDTRHSFASIMLSKGEEPMWVGCKMMGHKDLTETYKTYAKYLPKPITHRATFLQDIEI